MNVHFEVSHPAHVHLFKHAIDEIEERGHETLVTARDKEVTTDLLDAYGVEHTVLSEKGDSALGLATEWTTRGARLVRSMRSFGSDVVLGYISPVAAWASTLTRTPSVLLTDDEVQTRTLGRVTNPFASSILTPACFDMDLGAKHHRYDGFHELAYLHPDRFEPDRERLERHGVDVDEPYYVLRFVSWSAHHDVGQNGFSRAAKRELIDTLGDRGEVYVSSEGHPPPGLDAEPIPVPPDAIHDLLAHADCYAGDSQTMAIEAGVLGTPSVRSNSFVGSDDMSHFGVLEDRYELVHSIGEEGAAIERIQELASDPTASETWERRRERLFEESVDVTDVIVDAALEAGEA